MFAVASHPPKVSHPQFTRVVGRLGYALVVNLRRLIDNGDTLLELTAKPLAVGATYDWSVLPNCGAIVVFSGTVRNHSDGRDGVQTLAYEAYEEEVLPKCELISVEMRKQWPTLGRIALIHRLGELQLGESSVLVVVSSPHRPEAFEAARYGIDALKATVPIWKRETWNEGADWAASAQHVTTLDVLNQSRKK